MMLREAISLFSLLPSSRETVSKNVAFTFAQPRGVGLGLQHVTVSPSLRSPRLLGEGSVLRVVAVEREAQLPLMLRPKLRVRDEPLD